MAGAVGDMAKLLFKCALLRIVESAIRPDCMDRGRADHEGVPVNQRGHHGVVANALANVSNDAQPVVHRQHFGFGARAGVVPSLIQRALAIVARGLVIAAHVAKAGGARHGATVCAENYDGADIAHGKYPPYCTVGS